MKLTPARNKIGGGWRHPDSGGNKAGPDNSEELAKLRSQLVSQKSEDDALRAKLSAMQAASGSNSGKNHPFLLLLSLFALY